MTNLKINSDSERKLLDCETDKSFTILKWVADKMKLHAFECALTTLHKVSDIFKCRIDFLGSIRWKKRGKVKFHSKKNLVYKESS